jgi:uncharacterized membrane protein YfcA
MSILVLLVAIAGGAVAAVSGFGIGSLLTPVLAIRYGTKLAVGIVSIPHLIATVVRFLQLRQSIDKRIFVHFGVLSAIGGLLGALANAHTHNPALSIVFGCLLSFAGLSGLSGYVDRMRFGHRTAWVAGALSGFFGGLIGNQGGIRSAALLGFDIQKEALVATATAIALIVDGARMPVYLAIEANSILNAWMFLLVSVAGVLIGTFWGVRLLRRIPEKLYRKLLYALALALGIYMLIHGITRAKA